MEAAFATHATDAQWYVAIFAHEQRTSVVAHTAPDVGASLVDRQSVRAIGLAVHLADVVARIGLDLVFGVVVLMEGEVAFALAMRWRATGPFGHRALSVA